MIYRQNVQMARAGLKSIIPRRSRKAPIGNFPKKTYNFFQYYFVLFSLPFYFISFRFIFLAEEETQQPDDRFQP